MPIPSSGDPKKSTNKIGENLSQRLNDLVDKKNNLSAANVDVKILDKFEKIIEGLAQGLDLYNQEYEKFIENQQKIQDKYGPNPTQDNMIKMADEISEIVPDHVTLEV